MDDNWIMVYKIVDGEYILFQYGCNIVPTGNADKVIHSSEEIVRQANKFIFDGKKLKRKEGAYILTLEQLKEADRHEEIRMFGGIPPHLNKEKERKEIEVEF